MRCSQHLHGASLFLLQTFIDETPELFQLPHRQDRATKLLTYIAEISPRPVLLIHGEKAHWRYFSETAYAAAAEPKELLIIKGANHVDLYDQVNVIPFDKLTDFFTKNLK